MPKKSEKVMDFEAMFNSSRESVVNAGKEASTEPVRRDADPALEAARYPVADKEKAGETSAPEDAANEKPEDTLIIKEEKPERKAEEKYVKKNRTEKEKSAVKKEIKFNVTYEDMRNYGEYAFRLENEGKSEIKTISFTMERELREALQREAKESMLSVSKLVAVLLYKIAEK